MSSKILINAVDPEECRIAKVKDSKLEEFHIETASQAMTKGNIYKGIITRVEPSLQAVFIDYGVERHGFLQKNEIHSDYFLDNTSGDRSLKKLVRRGQELIVQITKDPVMKKGAMLTTFVSIPGRHIVLMPGGKNKGISRKIEDEDERKRLKDVVSGLNLPKGFGIIVRTAGEKSTKALLDKDQKYLLRLWKNITKKGMEEKAPFLLYRERNLAIRSIRDYFASDTTEILIDDEELFKEVKKFIKIISSRHTRIVKQYHSDKPIFSKYQLEEQITSIFKSRVKLKSGGTIVLDQTEALVAIDVNSGKSTSNKTIEETAFQTNIEAAEEIARQLRLRDLGGLIVIDFIDMKDPKHKSKVENVV
ncbi:MAG: Rne/Rng family ribonuclease, partial [Deltaproteobacteria bacterium]|nr:Rne/Rng family ribonuclease [Deltaproteobacteria bacterium]